MSLSRCIINRLFITKASVMVRLIAVTHWEVISFFRHLFSKAIPSAPPPRHLFSPPHREPRRRFRFRGDRQSSVNLTLFLQLSLKKCEEERKMGFDKLKIRLYIVPVYTELYTRLFMRKLCLLRPIYR